MPRVSLKTRKQAQCDFTPEEIEYAADLGRRWAAEGATPEQLERIASVAEGGYSKRIPASCLSRISAGVPAGVAFVSYLLPFLDGEHSRVDSKTGEATFWGTSMNLLLARDPQSTKIVDTFCLAALAEWRRYRVAYSQEVYEAGVNVGRNWAANVATPQEVDRLREFYKVPYEVLPQSLRNMRRDWGKWISLTDLVHVIVGPSSDEKHEDRYDATLESLWGMIPDRYQDWELTPLETGYVSGFVDGALGNREDLKERQSRVTSPKTPAELETP